MQRTVLALLLFLAACSSTPRRGVLVRHVVVNGQDVTGAAVWSVEDVDGTRVQLRAGESVKGTTAVGDSVATRWIDWESVESWEKVKKK